MSPFLIIFAVFAILGWVVAYILGKKAPWIDTYRKEAKTVKYCKLTNKHNRTYGGCQWGEGVTHRTDGKGGLCGKGWIHVYTHPLLAVLLNPIHANFSNPNLWLVKTAGKTLIDGGLKVGKTVVTTVERIDAPEITDIQRAAFAILLAQEVYKDEGFKQWALKWLSGEDRTTEAARATAAWAAAWAATAAAWAATAAAWAAAWVAKAAEAAATVWAADWAAAWAARAARAARAAAEGLDLIAIAKKALEIE